MKKGLYIPDKLEERKKFLYSYLSTFIDKKFYCKSIKKYVCFDKLSRKETITHACISTKGTELAFYMPYVLENMKPIKGKQNIEAQSKTQKKNFLNMSVFSCIVPGVGYAKILIGKRKNNNLNYEYSLTDFNYIIKKKKR